jgi:lysine-arginine-ornithine-binding protein
MHNLHRQIVENAKQKQTKKTDNLKPIGVNMSTKTLLSSVVLASTLIASQALAEIPKSIVIATEGVYPPFSFVENGELTGFDFDIATALCKKMEVECEIVMQEWDGMIPGLLAKKYDSIIAAMSITEERKKKVAFTEKYFNTPAVFVQLVDGGFDDVSPAALSGKLVAVQGSTTHSNYLEAKYPNSELRSYTTVDDSLADLRSGRVDVTLTDKILAHFWLEQDTSGCCEITGPDLFDPLFGEGKGIAVRKEDTELRDAFQKALDEILADGTYEKINNKYFPFSIY